MDIHLAFKTLVAGTYGIHNSDLMGQRSSDSIPESEMEAWYSNNSKKFSRSLGLQTFSLSLAPSLGERLLSYHEYGRIDLSSLCEAPTYLTPSKNHGKSKGIQVHSILPGFSELPCQWSLSAIKLGGILKFKPTCGRILLNLRGCFKIDDHADPLFTHFQETQQTPIMYEKSTLSCSA